MTPLTEKRYIWFYGMLASVLVQMATAMISGAILLWLVGMPIEIVLPLVIGFAFGAVTNEAYNTWPRE